MKSKLGEELQRLIDKPGAISGSRVVIWASRPPLGGGYRAGSGDLFFKPGDVAEYGDDQPKTTRRLRRRSPK